MTTAGHPGTLRDDLSELFDDLLFVLAPENEKLQNHHRQS